MLSQPAPFPFIGSHALLIDMDTDNGMNGHELVRILLRHWVRTGPVGVDGPANHDDMKIADVLVCFPLRDGASGDKRVPLDQLIDATPLTPEEAREFHDLDRELFGRTQFRTPKQKAAKARRDALKLRIIHAPIAERLLRQAAGKRARERGSVGMGGRAKQMRAA